MEVSRPLTPCHPPALPWLVRVAVELPRHAGLAGALDYATGERLAPGTLVRVPLGRREVCGVVWECGENDRPDDTKLRPVADALVALPALSANWRTLIEFAAQYYQRGIGELAATALPPELRRISNAAMGRRVARHTRPPTECPGPVLSAPLLTSAQAEAVAAVIAAYAGSPARPMLLHGVTGSGKTEVYLAAVEQALALGRQALVMVPEINLTPALTDRFERRFPNRRLVAMHSGLTPARRLASWMAAHLGIADIVLGTRLSVFASVPRLGLIVVDEEHDPSYKQQDGPRHSARDLAVYRAHREGIPVVLGSATPSLESWQRVLDRKYVKLDMAQRIGGAELPQLRVVDTRQLPRTADAAPVIADALLDAIRTRTARGEQSLIFLNRRGYAPVLSCGDCGWKSGCANCSAWRVFHKRERLLRCHHCGVSEPVPRACPDCGNQDIQPIGRGTERLEEQLADLLPDARIARIDGDSARTPAALEGRLAAVHAGDIDLLVGTQMITKGHDFRCITLVAAVNPDTALFSGDFRSAERLFALLMQAAGRAGRDAGRPGSEMWIQTANPAHPIYRALARHDYAAFAQTQLKERRDAGLPPFSHLALLRAEARDGAVALAFLRAASRSAAALSSDGLTVYDPVPPTISRVAGMERLQLLVESSSRTRLQRFLAAWMPMLDDARAAHKGLARWAIDVDPSAI
jgi:primosomal protein N' (replication factor Y)